MTCNFSSFINIVLFHSSSFLTALYIIKERPKSIKKKSNDSLKLGTLISKKKNILFTVTEKELWRKLISVPQAF